MAVTLEVNRKRIRRLMRILDIEAHYPKPHLSRPAPGDEIYPYLLRGVAIERPNQVWSTDTTKSGAPILPMFRCRAASCTWSRSWTGSAVSCSVGSSPTQWKPASAWRRWRTRCALGQPEIWNSDQGAQFTAQDVLAPLKRWGVSISMDGRGRALDNVCWLHQFR
jgi:putative transposase